MYLGLLLKGVGDEGGGNGSFVEYLSKYADQKLLFVRSKFSFPLIMGLCYTDQWYARHGRSPQNRGNQRKVLLDTVPYLREKCNSACATLTLDPDVEVTHAWNIDTVIIIMH